MNLFRLLPVIISMLLLAAHFYRAGILPLAAGALLSLGILFVRHPRAAWLMQLVLVAGSAEWLRTAYHLILARQAIDQPWGRLAGILGLVALGTITSALVFRGRKLGRHFRLCQEQHSGE